MGFDQSNEHLIQVLQNNGGSIERVIPILVTEKE